MSTVERVRNTRAATPIVAIALGVALALITVGVASAQIATALLGIRVADTNGQALPGVTIKVTQPATGLERIAVTDAQGAVEIAALPPGTYEVHFELSGFTPVTEENVVLRVGQTARITAALQQTAREEVTVVASVPMVDVHKMDSSTNVTPEQIESLPVQDRDFQKLAFITPGVERERGGYRFITNGPDIGSSGNASQATIMVDGVDFTDEALGLARARVSQDAIREFRVIQNRFDTEIGGSAGGALSIVTKTGTNLLQGTVFGYYRADRLRAKGALDLPCGGVSGCDTYNRGQYGFTLGGPIVKDRTHFFASFEYIKENNIVLFRPGGAFASTAADIKHPFNQTLGFASIDHSISDSQRLAANIVYERYREDNFHVGGVSDESWGNQLNRDNWNLTVSHTLVPSSNYLNELRAQIGNRKYGEPTNSNAPEEWFSVGNTLKTGTNTTGDIIGDGSQWEISDTAHLYGEKHSWKMGFSFQHIKEESAIPTFSNGTIIYLNDTRALPIEYLYGVGSADSHLSTNLIGVFLQDDWRPASNLTLSYGLRWDLDTNGNDPGFHHPLVPNGRSRDTKNYQPRVGFSWDIGNDGRNVMRGGVGRFAGRFLLVPAFAEQQQNGVTGRQLYTRVSGILFGLPPSTWLDPNNLSGSGILLAPAITLLAKDFKNPYTDQATLGWTTRLGSSGLYFDTEAIYDKGHDEIFIRDVNWSGNPLSRPNPAYSNINTYTNDGHSEYKALVLSLNGTLKGGNLLTASMTFANKKNLSDDFSPVYTTGYPNDPSNPEGEWGRSQSDERFRIVVSGVFNLGWGFTVAPIVEYGSGQPWTKRLGYDYNGDSFNSDRAPGVPRNGEDGPPFRQVNLRLTKALQIPSAGTVEIIVEGFNIFNTVNYDVNSINSGQYLSGPTITNPSAAYVANPLFGKYSATLPAREVQLALRYSF
jgi:Carboxypeptidase regulatory-like domain/TonB dependent receptor-like, beta-barrel